MARCSGCTAVSTECTCFLTVADTDTVDITLTGTGSEADPWVISADALGGGSDCAQKNVFTVATPGPTGLGLYLGTSEPFLSCADFVGDGINDEVAIDAAVTAAYAAYNPALPQPPEIYLNTGIFCLSDSVDLRGVAVEGAVSSIISNALGASGFNLLKNVGYITKVQIGDLLGALGAAPIKIDTLTSFAPNIDDVVMAINDIGADPGVIWFAINTSYRIQNSDFSSNTTGTPYPAIYDPMTFGPYKKICNNRFTGLTIDISEVAGSNAQIKDNVMFGNSLGPVVGDRGLINISAAGTAAIVNHEITGNHIIDSPGHGIVLTAPTAPGATQWFMIHDNMIHNYGTTGVAAYDGIFLSGRAIEHSIQGNVCHSTAAGARHGINISAAACTDNFVTNNNLFNSGAGASLNDAGTTTVTTAGNRL